MNKNEALSKKVILSQTSSVPSRVQEICDQLKNHGKNNTNYELYNTSIIPFVCMEKQTQTEKIQFGNNRNIFGFTRERKNYRSTTNSRLVASPQLLAHIRSATLLIKSKNSFGSSLQKSCQRNHYLASHCDPLNSYPLIIHGGPLWDHSKTFRTSPQNFGSISIHSIKNLAKSNLIQPALGVKRKKLLLTQLSSSCGFRTPPPLCAEIVGTAKKLKLRQQTKKRLQREQKKEIRKRTHNIPLKGTRNIEKLLRFSTQPIIKSALQEKVIMTPQNSKAKCKIQIPRVQTANLFS